LIAKHIFCTWGGGGVGLLSLLLLLHEESAAWAKFPENRNFDQNTSEILKKWKFRGKHIINVKEYYLKKTF
jgi:hypothetical protein